MELLEFLERGNDILFLRQFLGLLAELLLGLQVLLEVEVAQVAVDLDQVVELLHVELVGVVDVPEGRDGNRADFAPAVLDLAELREGVPHLALLFDQGFQFLDDGLLLHEVVLALGIELPVVLGALLLVIIVKGLETGFNRGEGILDSLPFLGGRGLGGRLRRCGGRLLGRHFLRRFLDRVG